MTKKQLKQLAKNIAELEYTIQTCSDPNKVNEAKNRMIQAQEAADISFEDLMMFDDLVQKYLEEKNI